MVEQFRVDLIKETIQVKHNQLEVPGFAIEELDKLCSISVSPDAG